MKLRDFSLLLIGILITGIVVVTAKPHNDYTQMYLRALKLFTTGEWTHYGNLSSGIVKYIPGTLLTFLTVAPMWIYKSLYAPNVLIFLLNLLALYLFANVLKGSYKKEFEWTPLLIIFWINPWRLAESVLWNPAYLPFLSILHLWASFKLRKEKSFMHSCILVLCVGFAFQIHLSAMILLILSGLLFLRKEIKVSFGGIILGCFLVLLSLVPYALTALEHPEIYRELPGQSSDYNKNHFFLRNLIFVYPLLKTFGYWIRFPSIYIGRKPFTELKMSWIEPTGISGKLLEYPYKISLAIGFILTTVITLWAFLSYLEQGKVILKKFNIPALNSIASEKIQEASWLRRYFGLSFLASLLSTAISPVELNYWQLLPCFPLALIALYDLYIGKRHPKIKLYFKYLSIMFMLHGFFTALESELHNYRFSFSSEMQRILSESFPKFFN
jgi:hypothetical protein